MKRIFVAAVLLAATCVAIGQTVPTVPARVGPRWEYAVYLQQATGVTWQSSHQNVGARDDGPIAWFAIYKQLGGKAVDDDSHMTFPKLLDLLGSDGWELVTRIDPDQGTSFRGTELIFKRSARD